MLSYRLPAAGLLIGILAAAAFLVTSTASAQTSGTPCHLLTASDPVPAGCGNTYFERVTNGPNDGPWNGLGIGIFVRTASFGNQKFGRGRVQSIRFVAEKTGQVKAVMPYFQVLPQPAYSEDDGGRVSIHLHEDNNGQPGKVIGTGPMIDRPRHTLQLIGGGGVVRQEFDLVDNPKPTITKGKVYHWVFRQIGTSGRISMGGITDRRNDHNIPVPVFGNNMIHMFGSIGSMQPHRQQPGGYGPTGTTVKFPIFATVYTDGTYIGQLAHQGLRDDRKSVDGNNRIRAVMKPTTDRIVRYVYVAPWKTANQSNGDMLAEVKDSSGRVLATATIPAREIGYDPDHGSGYDKGVVPWVMAALSSELTFKGGQTYYVEFSAPSGAGIWFMSMMEHHQFWGADYDLRFKEPRGQFSSDGGKTWTNALYRGNSNSNTMYSILLHYY